MSDYLISSRSLLDLPHEIISNILNHLEKRELKLMRLTCKTLNVLTPARLFEWILLFPHARYLERLALMLRKSPTIRASIKHITYDLRWLPAIDFLEIYMGAKWRGTLEAKERVLVLRRQILKDAFTPKDDAIFEFTLLQRLIKLIPCVKRIEVIEAELWYGYDDDHYGPQLYSQVDTLLKTSGHLPYGLQDVWYKSIREYDRVWSSSGSCKTALLAASAAKNPVRLDVTAFRMENILGRSSFAKSATIMNRALSNICELNLRFTEEEVTEDSVTDITMKNLGHMLKFMPALEGLAINFMPLWRLEREFRDESRQPISVFNKILPSWNGTDRVFASSSKLADLYFKDLFCFEDELYALLDQVSHSLASLELVSLRLLPRTIEGPKPCLVRALKYLSRMNLKRFRMSGIWQNTGAQNWSITQPFPPQPGRFVERVCKFVLEGGECPLNDEAIPDGIDDIARTRMNCGAYDDTWRTMSFWDALNVERRSPLLGVDTDSDAEAHEDEEQDVSESDGEGESWEDYSGSEDDDPPSTNLSPEVARMTERIITTFGLIDS